MGDACDGESAIEAKEERFWSKLYDRELACQRMLPALDKVCDLARRLGRKMLRDVLEHLRRMEDSIEELCLIIRCRRLVLDAVWHDMEPLVPLELDEGHGSMEELEFASVENHWRTFLVRISVLCKEEGRDMDGRASGLSGNLVERLYRVLDKRDAPLGRAELFCQGSELRHLVALAPDELHVIGRKTVVRNDEIALPFLLIVFCDRAGKDACAPLLLDEALDLRDRTDMGIGVLFKHIGLPVSVEAGGMRKLAELIGCKHPIDIEYDDGLRLCEIGKDIRHAALLGCSLTLQAYLMPLLPSFTVRIHFQPKR
jgi:hypothetical protein